MKVIALEGKYVQNFRAARLFICECNHLEVICANQRFITRSEHLLCALARTRKILVRSLNIECAHRHGEVSIRR